MDGAMRGGSTPSSDSANATAYYDNPLPGVVYMSLEL